MADITKAQEARREKTLNKQIVIDNKVLTVKQWITGVVTAGGYVDTKEVPSIQFNRTKYNRMDYREQAEYDRKLSIMKTEYRLHDGNNKSFWSISKTEYDFASTL